jgi:hypothetical protein
VFLAGVDALTGKDYSHRREWIRRRLEALASVFSIDINKYGFVHRNPIHRIDPTGMFFSVGGLLGSLAIGGLQRSVQLGVRGQLLERWWVDSTHTCNGPNCGRIFGRIETVEI